MATHPPIQPVNYKFPARKKKKVTDTTFNLRRAVVIGQCKPHVLREDWALLALDPPSWGGKDRDSAPRLSAGARRCDPTVPTSVV